MGMVGGGTHHGDGGGALTMGMVGGGTHHGDAAAVREAAPAAVGGVVRDEVQPDGNEALARGAAWSRASVRQRNLRKRRKERMNE